MTIGISPKSSATRLPELGLIDAVLCQKNKIHPFLTPPFFPRVVHRGFQLLIGAAAPKEFRSDHIEVHTQASLAAIFCDDDGQELSRALFGRQRLGHAAHPYPRLLVTRGTRKAGSFQTLTTSPSVRAALGTRASRPLEPTKRFQSPRRQSERLSLAVFREMHDDRS